jgi:hypothetical protein
MKPSTVAPPAWPVPRIALQRPPPPPPLRTDVSDRPLGRDLYLAPPSAANPSSGPDSEGERQPSPLLPPFQRPPPLPDSRRETVEFCLVANRSTLDLRVDTGRSGGLQRAKTAPTGGRSMWPGVRGLRAGARAAQAPCLSTVCSEGGGSVGPATASRRGSDASCSASSVYSQSSWGTESLYRFSPLLRRPGSPPELDPTSGTLSEGVSPQTPIGDARLSFGDYWRGVSDTMPPDSPDAPKPLTVRKPATLREPDAPPTAGLSYVFQEADSMEKPQKPRTTIPLERLETARKENRRKALAALIPSLGGSSLGGRLKRTVSLSKKRD